MENFELNDKSCRICLDENTILNWNNEILEFCGMTFRDCYYKYTQLEMLVIDPFSQMLCQKCSTHLKNSHSLVVKALESHAILQEAYPTDTQILSTENQAIKEIMKSGNDIYEPEYDSEEFELMLKQNDEPLWGGNHYENEYKATENKTLNDSIQEKRKRVGKNPKWIDNNIYEVDIPKSSITTISLSSEEEFCNKSIQKKTKEYNSDNQEFVEKLGKQNRQTKKEILTKTHHSRDNSYPEDKKADSEKTYMCSICSKTYRSKKMLTEHEESHSEHRQRSEICPHCGIKLFNKCAMDIHLKIHIKNREKKYKCDFCYKAYFNRGGLNIHRRIHLGQMIACPICSKEFFRQSELDRHTIVAHSATTIHSDAKKQSKYYVYCKDCNKNLRTMSWKAHQAAHLKEPLLQCSICDKEFFSRSTCTYHMQKLHNFKTREEYEEFIIYCKPNRLSHLLLEQQDILKPITS